MWSWMCALAHYQPHRDALRVAFIARIAGAFDAADGCGAGCPQPRPDVNDRAHVHTLPVARRMGRVGCAGS